MKLSSTAEIQQIVNYLSRYMNQTEHLGPFENSDLSIDFYIPLLNSTNPMPSIKELTDAELGRYRERNCSN